MARSIAFREALREAMNEEMRRDDRVFIMGEEDKAVPVKDSLEQCHLPRISYIHILTRSAHMGMIENTSLCNSFVDRFLSANPF